MDPTTLTDEQLDDHRRAVLTEQERRAKLAQLPDQLADMAVKFRDGGGDDSALTEAISEPEEKP